MLPAACAPLTPSRGRTDLVDARQSTQSTQSTRRCQIRLATVATATACASRGQILETCKAASDTALPCFHQVAVLQVCGGCLPSTAALSFLFFFSPSYLFPRLSPDVLTLRSRTSNSSPASSFSLARLGIQHRYFVSQRTGRSLGCRDSSGLLLCVSVLCGASGSDQHRRDSTRGD